MGSCFERITLALDLLSTSVSGTKKQSFPGVFLIWNVLLFPIILFVFFWDNILLCCTGWSAVAWSWLTATSASWVAGITGACHHVWLIFVFLVEMGFCHVGQSGLELLTSWSTRLGLPKCWDYRLEPARTAGNMFLISNSTCSLLTYRKAFDFFVFTSYSTTVP